MKKRAAEKTAPAPQAPPQREGAAAAQSKFDSMARSAQREIDDMAKSARERVEDTLGGAHREESKPARPETPSPEEHKPRHDLWGPHRDVSRRPDEDENARKPAGGQAPGESGRDENDEPGGSSGGGFRWP